ncbi:COQ9 family protein [Albidovulum sp.]
MEGDLRAVRERMLEAARGHAVFDGWSEATFRAACRDVGIAPELGRALFPRGAVDLAVADHRAGDRAMAAALGREDPGALRFRDRVARAIRLRLELADRERARRAAALFALPQHAATGASLLWGTADAIWRALGDRSEDVNWYTKRATLSAVYAATLLYWLGDESEGQAASWDFLDRRIGDVMRFESAKARAREHPLLGRLLAVPGRLLRDVRPPADHGADLPGRISEPEAP